MFEQLDPHVRAAQVRERQRQEAFAREAVWVRAWMEENEPDLVAFLDLSVKDFNARLRRYWCPLKQEKK